MLDISTEDHLENIHQREILISASSSMNACMRAYVCASQRACMLGQRDEHLARHESSVVQPSIVISLIIFNGHSFM